MSVSAASTLKSSQDENNARIVVHPSSKKFEQNVPSPLRVQIYSDGADLDSMVSLSKQPMVAGLTTNPTLMKKAGITDYRAFCHSVLKEIKDKPISFEVFADDFAEMERQAFEIASWGENVYVKIPITNTKGEDSCPLMAKLSTHGVKINATALLTLEQVFAACDALRHGAPSIISVFAGRIADTGVDPLPIMKAAKEICRAVSPKSQLLWASPREVYNVMQANEAGVDIITITSDVMAKIAMFGKSLSELSLDTVKMFYRDAQSAGYQL